MPKYKTLLINEDCLHVAKAFKAVIKFKLFELVLISFGKCNYSSISLNSGVHDAPHSNYVDELNKSRSMYVNVFHLFKVDFDSLWSYAHVRSKPIKWEHPQCGHLNLIIMKNWMCFNFMSASNANTTAQRDTKWKKNNKIAWKTNTHTSEPKTQNTNEDEMTHRCHRCYRCYH